MDTTNSAVATFMNTINNAVAALVDITIYTVQWRFLWIRKFIQCSGGFYGYN
jgi:hypothetical protein